MILTTCENEGTSRLLFCENFNECKFPSLGSTYVHIVERGQTYRIEKTRERERERERERDSFFFFFVLY